MSLHDSRQAGALCELGILGAGEGFAEGLQRLGCRLGKLAEDWESILSPHEVLTLDSYLNGRFALLVQADVAGHKYCIAAYARPTESNHSAVVGFEYGVLSQLGDLECGDEQVVLLPVAQVVQGAKQSVPAIREIPVRFYPVGEEFDNLIDHPTIGFRFKNVADGRFNTFPIARERDIALALRLWFDRTSQAHEAKIEAGAEVVAGVPNEAGDCKGWLLSNDAVERVAASLRIFCEGNMIRLRLDEGVNLPVELLNQFVGPYDLKGRVSEG